MTAYEYLNALRQALDVLPEEERQNAIRYYEDYFLDAGPEHEADVIRELGDPQAVAAAILADYREIVRGAPRQAPPRPHGTWRERLRQKQPLTILVIVLLAALIGGPLLAAVGGTLGALVIAVLAVALVVLLIPAILAVCGAALVIFSFFVVGSIASMALTMGAGLIVLALAGFALLLFIKLWRGVVRPFFRWLFNAVRGLVCRLRGGIR